MSFAALLLSSCAMTPQAPSARARNWRRPETYPSESTSRISCSSTRTVRAGEYSGIAVDWAGTSASARVPVELVAFDTRESWPTAVKPARGTWPSLGSEPSRANEIAFSAAYLEIEAGYSSGGLA